MNTINLVCRIGENQNLSISFRPPQEFLPEVPAGTLAHCYILSSAGAVLLTENERRKRDKTTKAWLPFKPFELLQFCYSDYYTNSNLFLRPLAEIDDVDYVCIPGHMPAFTKAMYQLATPRIKEFAQHIQVHVLQEKGCSDPWADYLRLREQLRGMGAIDWLLGGIYKEVLSKKFEEKFGYAVNDNTVRIATNISEVCEDVEYRY